MNRVPETSVHSGRRPYTIYTFLLLLGMASGCIALKPVTQPAANFDRQGHRGARGLMPENTIPAMIRAIEEGVTTLEMDVVITADSAVILSHEPWMNSEIATKSDGSLL
jgi:glycerophosphoryl diester phosphodiesterase